MQSWFAMFGSGSVHQALNRWVNVERQMQDLPSICLLSLNLSAGTRKPESGDLSSYTPSWVEDSEIADLYTRMSVLIGGPLVANLL